MKIDITKPVQTRDGRKVTDLHWLSKPLEDGETLIGVVDDPEGYRSSYSWHENGIFIEGEQSEADLVAVPEETVRWANVYNDANGQKILVTVESRERADRVGSEDRIGLFKFTFIEGQDPKAEFVPLEEDE